MIRGLTLLLLNSQADTIDLLEDWFGAHGAVVHHARSLELCRDLNEAALLTELIRPHVILFDLSIPYRQSWECFQRLTAAGIFGNVPIVLTTTNRRALDELVGPTDAFEVIGTSRDLSKLQELIEWRLTARTVPLGDMRH